jgi:hypothetical protein
VNPEDVDEFLKAWEAGAAYFKSQPGLISAQLHKGIGGSGTFINYAIRESTAQLRKAVNNTNLQTRLSNYPASTIISPHIFKKVVVLGSVWNKFVFILFFVNRSLLVQPMRYTIS